jgi:hypothetical protein
MRPIFKSLIRVADSVFMKRPSSFFAAKRIIEATDAAVTAAAKPLGEARKKVREAAPVVLKYSAKTGGILFELLAGSGDVPPKKRSVRRKS